MTVEGDASWTAGHIPQVEPRPEIRRAFSVEMQTEFDALTKTVERRVFTKVYSYARTSGLIAALGPRGWQTLTVLATYMDADGDCFPSQSEIADALKITRQAANERIKELLAFWWDGKPIILACKVRGDGQRFENTRYTILPVTGFQFGPDSPDQPMSTGGDTAPARAMSTAGDMGGMQGMSITDDTAAGEAMSSAVDTNKICAVLPSEDKPRKATTASGKGSETSLEAEVNSAREESINTARTHARKERLNTARVKAPPNPDVRTLLLRHAQCYQDKVGAPYPIAWGKDGAIVKRLLQTYSADELVLLQDTFFGQPADSQAAFRGYTVQRLEYEAPALMPRIKLRENMTDEQREAVAALCGEGVSEATALALLAEHPVSDNKRQLRAHEDRKDRLRNPAAALVKAVRENWEIPEEDEPDYYKPLPKAGRDDKELVPAPPWFQENLERAIAHLTGKDNAP